MPVHETFDRGWVIAIAGLARDGVSNITPLPLAEDCRQPAPSRFQDAYARLIVPGSIQLGAQSVSPISGDPRIGTLEFTVSMPDDVYPEIGRFFFKRPLLHDAEFTSTIGIGTTVFQWGAGQVNASGVAVDDVIYIEREAFRVAAVDGGLDTVTVVDSLDDGDGTTTARAGNLIHGRIGHFRTHVRSHTAPGLNDPYPRPDTRVRINATPFVRGREVTLYYSDGENLETVVGRYIIEDPPRTVGGGSAVRIRCRDFMAALKGTQFGARAVGGTVRSANPDTTLNYFDASLIVSPRTDEAAKGSLWTQEAAGQWGGDFAGVIEIGDTVIVASGAEPTDAYRAIAPDLRSIRSPLTGAFATRQLLRDDLQSLDGKAWNELLVSYTGFFPDETKHPYYTTDTTIVGGVAGVCQHPLDILRAHLGTVQTNLPDHWKVWGERIEADEYVDDDDIVRIRDAGLPDWTFPGIIAGHKRKPIKALGWLHEQLLSWHALCLAFTDEGRLTVRSFIPSLSDGQATITDDHVLRGAKELTVDTRAEVDVIRAEMTISGTGEPLDTGFTQSAYDQRWMQYATASHTVKPHGLMSAAESGDDLETVRRLGDVLTTIAELLRHGPAMLDLRLSASEPVYPGETRKLSLWGVRDPTTGAIDETQPTAFFAFIMRRQLNPQDHSQTVSCYLYPFSEGGRIGATAEVLGVVHGAGTSTLTCSATDWIVDASYDYERSGSSAFGTITKDVEQFEVGQRARIVDEFGVPVSDVFTVDVVTPGSDELGGSDGTSGTSGVRIQAVGGGDYSFTAGDHVVFSLHANARSEDTERFGWFGKDTYRA